MPRPRHGGKRWAAYDHTTIERSWLAGAEGADERGGCSPTRLLPRCPLAAAAPSAPAGPRADAGAHRRRLGQFAVCPGQHADATVRRAGRHALRPGQRSGLDPGRCRARVEPQLCHHQHRRHRRGRAGRLAQHRRQPDLPDHLSHPRRHAVRRRQQRRGAPGSAPRGDGDAATDRRAVHANRPVADPRPTQPLSVRNLAALARPDHHGRCARTAPACR